MSLRIQQSVAPHVIQAPVFLQHTPPWFRPQYSHLAGVEMFKEFRLEVEKQLGKSIKALRLDQSEEYLNQEFQSYLRDNKILSQWI